MRRHFDARRHAQTVAVHRGEHACANGFGIDSGLRRMGELALDPLDTITYPDTPRGRNVAEQDARWAVEHGEFDRAEVITLGASA